MPLTKAQPATVTSYTIAVLEPNAFQMVTNEAALVAGPVIRKTSAAPGVNPFSMSAAATGTEAVAHTYTGIPKNIITTIAKIPVPNLSAK